MHVWYFLPLLAVSTTVLAQTPALTIEQRLDKLERENADLKRQLKTRPTTASPPTPAAQKLAAGWTMLVYPRLSKNQEPFPIGAFVAKGSGFRFGDLRTQTSHAGWASFKGEGVFYAYAEGPYSFSMELRGTERLNFLFRMTCDVTLRIGDSDLIPTDQGHFILQNNGIFDKTLAGGTKLPAGEHPAEFQVGCQFSDAGDDADRLFQRDPRIKTTFDDIRVAINVFGPNDRTARPLRDDELGHQRKRSTTNR